MSRPVEVETRFFRPKVVSEQGLANLSQNLPVSKTRHYETLARRNPTRFVMPRAYLLLDKPSVPQS